MQVFDLRTMVPHPYDEREKNVFYQGPRFKARIIELPAGGGMPTCEMPSYVLFYVIRGEVEVQVNGEVATLREGQCLITEPATVSMKTERGVRMMGIQVATG
jgi:quercetin dioxygenase-like cupin family protein